MAYYSISCATFCIPTRKNTRKILSRGPSKPGQWAKLRIETDRTGEGKQYFKLQLPLSSSLFAFGRADTCFRNAQSIAEVSLPQKCRSSFSARGKNRQNSSNHPPITRGMSQKANVKLRDPASWQALAAGVSSRNLTRLYRAVRLNFAPET